jgi:hypothetical protein
MRIIVCLVGGYVFVALSIDVIFSDSVALAVVYSDIACPHIPSHTCLVILHLVGYCCFSGVKDQKAAEQ